MKFELTRTDYTFIAIFIFISSAIFLYSCPTQIQITKDSLQYEIAAKAIKNGIYFNLVEGNKIALWPPLYPKIISYLIPHQRLLLKFIHLLFITINILFIVQLSKLFFNTKTVFWSNIALSVFSIYPYHFGRYMWSETIFITLFLALIVAILKYNKHKKTYNLFLIAILSISLCMQRNAGLFIVSGMIIGSFFILKNRRVSLILLIGIIFWIAYQISIKTSGIPLKPNGVFFEFKSVRGIYITYQK